MSDKHEEEIYLVLLQKEILESRKWNDVTRRIFNGKDPPKARVERIEIAYIPELFGVIPLASFMRDGIIFNEAYYLVLPSRLKKCLLAHEMLHAYMCRHGIVGWNDRDDEFITYAHCLGCDLEMKMTVKWRPLGGKWREG